MKPLIERRLRVRRPPVHLALCAALHSACGVSAVGPALDAAPATDAASAPLDGAVTRFDPDGATPDAGCGPCGRVCSEREVCVSDVCVPRAGSPPRLVGPSSLGRLTTQRPTLRWRLPAGERTARVMVCRDRACADVVHRAAVSGSALRLADALAPGVYFWRVLTGQGVASATWEFQVRAHDAIVDTLHTRMTDLDGDGYGDMMVTIGAPQRRAVYAGGPRGVAQAPTTTFPTQPDGSSLRVSSVGDLDGDGYGDLLSFAMVGVERRAYLHRGGPQGASASPAMLAVAEPWPDATASAGDVDGDGYNDLVGVDQGVSGPLGRVRVLFGAPSGVLRESTVIVAADVDDATSVVTTGSADVNGDGLPDFLFGVPSHDDGAGRAFVWVNDGCATGHVVALPGDTRTYAHFGDSVGLSGDYNGDGYADAVVAAPHDPATVDQSALWVFPGSAAGPVTAGPLRIPFAGRQTESLRVVGVGDLNGDGLADLGAWMHTSLRPPELVIFYGAAAGLATTPSRALTSDDFGPDERGFSASGVGDTDRDGFDELLVFLSPGHVVVSRGTAAGPSTGMIPYLTLP